MAVVGTVPATILQRIQHPTEVTGRSLSQLLRHGKCDCNTSSVIKISVLLFGCVLVLFM